MKIDHDEGLRIYTRKNQILHHLLVHLQVFPSLFGMSARDSPVGFVEISWAHDKVVHTSCLRGLHVGKLYGSFELTVFLTLYV